MHSIFLFLSVLSIVSTFNKLRYFTSLFTKRIRKTCNKITCFNWVNKIQTESHGHRKKKSESVRQSCPAAAAAKSHQSCPTLCNPIDGTSPGSPVPGILQARTLEWGAISFSNAWKWKLKVKSLSHVRLFTTPGLQPTRLLRPWDFPGKSTGMGCHVLVKGIFPTQGSNLHLPHCRQILYCLSHREAGNIYINESLGLQVVKYLLHSFFFISFSPGNRGKISEEIKTKAK